jgi:hypothetical protein
MAQNVYDRVGPFYLQYYRSQIGRGDGGGGGNGDGPRVFYGSARWRRRQDGDGFGSILRGLAQVALPILGRGIGAFATHTLDATERGVSLGDAARSALKPTLQAVVSAGADQFAKAAQGGNGGKKRRGNMSSPSEFYERMQAAKRRKRAMKLQSGTSGRGKTKSKTKKKRQTGRGRKQHKVGKVARRGSGHQHGAGRKRRAGKKAYKMAQSGSGGACNF